MSTVTYRWDLRDEEHEEDDDEESRGAVGAPLPAVPARVRVLAAVLTTAATAPTAMAVRLSGTNSVK